MTTPVPRPRLPLWAVLVLTVSGMAVFAVLGHVAASGPPLDGMAAVANIAVGVPQGWTATVGEPNQILLQGGATIALVSDRRETAADARTLTAALVQGARDANPAATTCIEPDVAPMPGLSYTAIRAGVCTPGEASLLLLTAVAPDQLTIFVVSVEAAPGAIAAAEDLLVRVLGPTIRWKLVEQAP